MSVVFNLVYSPLAIENPCKGAHSAMAGASVTTTEVAQSLYSCGM